MTEPYLIPDGWGEPLRKRAEEARYCWMCERQHDPPVALDPMATCESFTCPAFAEAITALSLAALEPYVSDNPPDDESAS